MSAVKKPVIEVEVEDFSAEQWTEDTGTSIAITIPETSAIEAAFTKEGGTAKMIAEIKKMAEECVMDVSTKAGRDGIRATAYKVSQSKVAIVKQAKALVEKERAKIAVVNGEVKVVETELDGIRDLIRKPLNDWEAVEAKRIKVIKDKIQAIKDLGSKLIDGQIASFRDLFRKLAELAVDESYGEFFEEAKTEWAVASDRLTFASNAHNEMLAQQQELEALRKEKADREAKDLADAKRHELEEAEAKAKADAAQKERDLAEAEKKAADDRAAALAQKAKDDEAAAAQKRIDDEESAKRHAAELAEAALKAEADAKAKADADKLALEERHKVELHEANDRAEKAAQAERDRLAKEEQDAKQAREKRAADMAHRQRIKAKVTEAITNLTGRTEDAHLIVEAIMEGKIPHTSIEL